MYGVHLFHLLVPSDGTTGHRAAHGGRPFVIETGGSILVTTCKQRAMDGAGRSERSDIAMNKRVCFRKRLRAADSSVFNRGLCCLITENSREPNLT